MDSDLWQRARDLFLTLVEADDEEQAARLESIRCEDSQLAAAVEQLFSAHATTGLIDKVEDAAAAFGQIRQQAMARAPRPLTAGDLVGDFEIIGELGSGGMATVYRARRVTDDFLQEVALKVLAPSRLGGGTLARFEFERKIAAKLDHPEIARLIDGGLTEDGRPFFALELVDGIAIDEYCDQNRLSVPDRVRLIIQVAAAVHYAHQNLLVHRDLKPSNILADGEGRPRLLDFGIAKPLDPEMAGAAHTQTGARLLTPIYSSPEQFLGQAITTASDQYQLGLLLFELVTGRRHHLLDGEDPSSIGRRITEAATPRPSLLLQPRTTQHSADGLDQAALEKILERRRLESGDLKGVAGDLDTIILKALEKNPGRRYASVKAFAEDLERYLSDQPIHARPASGGYRLSKFAKRHRFAVSAAALGLLALIGGTIVASWQAIRASRAEQAALVEAATASRVSEFLVELFEGADPGVNSGRVVSAKEILDLGRRQLEHDLEDEPAVRGRLLRELSQIYHHLGDLEGSVELGQKALEVHRAALDPDSPDIAEDQFRLAEVFSRLNRFDEAEESYQSSHDIHMRIHGPDSAEVASSLIGLGKILAFQGDIEGAEALQRKALALRLKHLEPISAPVAHSYYYLGWVLRRNGRYQEALEALKLAADIDRQVFGEISRDYAEDLTMIGSVLGNLGQTEEAIAIGQEQVKIAGAVYGPDHLITIRGLEPLALNLIEVARYEEAEAYILRSLDAKRQIYGERSRPVGGALHNLGYLQQDRGQFEQAKSTYIEAIAIKGEALGAEHPNVAEVRENLGETLVELGQLDEAESCFRRSLGDKKAGLRPDHPRLSWPHWGLGLVAWHRGEMEEARRELGTARDLIQAELGPDHPDLAYSLHVLANVARDQKAFAEAEPLYEKVLELRSGYSSKRLIFRRTLEDRAELRRRMAAP